MDLNLNVLQLASRLMSHSAVRQQVIAENIAHADTPGYRARDVTSFQETLDNTVPPFSAKLTRPGHIPFGAADASYSIEEVTAFGAESPNGNTVSLEDQMMRATDVRQHHDMALGVYQKSIDILRASLGR
jgi:flagellar basal-body rod protein FlgB